MKIKHSKFKNTGLIYELLVRQITSDLVARKSSPAVDILRKFYSGDGAILKEFKLYKAVVESTGLLTIKADSLINAALKTARNINLKELRQAKYDLVSEIKEHYNLEDFFGITVPNYKPLAAFYCLLEADRSVDLINPQSIVNNKVTLLEHMTSRYQPKEDVTNSLIEEYSNYDKDLRLLVLKVLLEKFNEKYTDLLPEQKNILKQFITLGSTRKLKQFVNEEIVKLRESLNSQLEKMPRGVERIKLQEAIKMIEPLSEKEKVTDDHLVRILQYFELQNELGKVI